MWKIEGNGNLQAPDLCKDCDRTKQLQNVEYFNCLTTGECGIFQLFDNWRMWNISTV